MRSVLLVLLAGCRLDVPAGLPCEPGRECPDAPGGGGDGAADGAVDGTPLPRCGDDMVRFGVEECDDGNLEDGDGCSALCSRCAIGDDSQVLPLNHHCYARFSTTRAWNDARDDCAARGLELATFQAAGEDQVVYDIRLAGGGYNLWFGLSQQESVGTFRWVTEEGLTDTHWAAGEPNGGGDCARTTDFVEWEDAGCGDPHQYICEDPGWTLGPDAHAYKRLTGYYDWDAAAGACAGLGAHLVAITSQEESDFVEAQVAFQTFWIGARADDGTTWLWSGGESFAFTAWQTGEPAALAPPMCAVSGPSGWAASACSGPARHAVCEID